MTGGAKFGAILLALVNLSLLFVGCGSSDEASGSGDCEPDTVSMCACPDGSTGLQMCSAERTLGDCACNSDVMGSAAGTGGGTGGGLPAGGSAGVPSGGAPSGGSGGSTTTGMFNVGTCDDEPPVGAPQAPDPPAYSGGACPELVTGTTWNVLPTVSGQREFLVVVPEDPQPGETFPVVFLWHWLNADGMSFYERADAQTAVNEQRFIAVMPNGIGQLPANWPWSTLTSLDVMEAEFVFFDDMLACISEQFPVNKNCVASAGVSDGALWTSQLAGGRGQYLSSIIVLSGGVDANFVIGDIRPWTPSPHKMPAIVLWGGPTDVCLVLPFEQASLNLEAALTADGHFIIECIHDCGHAEPPFEGPGGMTKFAALWDFVKVHPYWLPDGGSPYNETGLPEGIPSWCAIGAGNAIPRMDGTGCGGPGC